MEDAFRFCEKITRDHYENFPVASFLIPRDKRKHIAAVYAFARIADDFADESGLAAQERLEKLGVWENHLEACYQDEPRGPVFTALRETVKRFGIPRELLQRLLQAFTSDVTVKRYETFQEVLAYCRNSANPVGRFVLLLFGKREEPLMELSDSICTALQLTNFWQDVSIDLDKDRVYLPQEDLRRFSVSEGQLASRSCTPEFRKLLEFQVERTRDLFYRGKPLLNLVDRRLAFELALTWLGGMKVLRKIEKAGYDVFRKRLVLSDYDKVGVLAKSLLRRNASA